VRYLEAGRLEEHYGELIRPENTIVVVAGDVDPQLVEQFVRTYAERWTMGGRPLPAIAAEFYTEERFGEIPSLISTREDQIRKQRSQTAMAVAFPTVPRNHPDTPAMEVLQAVTGGLGGLFFEEIRTRRGLAYQVSTFDVSRALAGFFGTFVACSPDSAERVRELVIEMHQQLADEPLDEAVVDRARNYLAGSYVVGLQTRRAQVNELGSLALLGLDLEEFDRYPERIRAVSREDLQRIAEEYFRDRPYAFSAVVGTEGSSADPR
jgi:predicted Zn-dependent peptidase